MALQNSNPTTTNAWKKLDEHFRDIEHVHMKDWFEKDPERANHLSLKWDDFYLDYSKNRITTETINLFDQLAEEVHLRDAINKYFSGAIINQTENRAVLHTALRAKKDDEIFVNHKNIVPEVYDVRKKIKTFSDGVVSGEFKGFTKKPFTDIVNIGIGGSDLGPAMVVNALKYYNNHLNTHFISNVDGDHSAEVLKTLDPETTLFVVVSKTFTTQETLTNANTCRNWFLERATREDIAKHFVAVSTNIKKVKEFGISEENIFPMWDWVGGRFSLWSAVGLSISLSIGNQNFENLLKGAQKMDIHFKTQPFVDNMPVVMAFLSIWYNNFFECESEAVIAYSQYLDQFATYLQQAIMESNGKGVDRNGKVLNYQSGTIVWGEPGTNSQHAFFQLIHQGTKLIPSDFIGFAKSLYGNEEHHDKLISNFLAQTEALMNGKSEKEVIDELKRLEISDKEREALAPFKIFSGNRPTNTLFIKKLTPENLGKLIALYEHKIFVQGVIWNIFSYDQFGVELGKQLAGNILKELNNLESSEHDSSTKNLIEFYKNNR